MDEASKLAALVGSAAHSLVVVADNGLGDEGSKVVVIVPADTLDGKGDVSSRDVVVTDTDLRTDEGGLSLRLEVRRVLDRGGGKAAKVLLSEVHELLVGDATSADENHAVGSVVVLDVVGELGTGDIADVLTGAEDGTAERLVLEGGGMQVVEHNLVDLLLNLLGLAENDVALTLDG